LKLNEISSRHQICRSFQFGMAGAEQREQSVPEFFRAGRAKDREALERIGRMRERHGSGLLALPYSTIFGGAIS
jgi:hypothetical protein